MQGNTNLVRTTRPTRNNESLQLAQARKLTERERQDMRAQQRADKRGVQ